MKKNYLMPEANFVNVSMENNVMTAVSGGGTHNGDYGSDDRGNSASGREWGNVWGN